MTGNEDPKVELQNMRALLSARLAEETEQARRFRQFANDRDARVVKLTTALVEVDAAIGAINSRRRP